MECLGLLCVMSAPNCPCPKKDCPRHSNCEECVKHHKRRMNGHFAQGKKKVKLEFFVIHKVDIIRFLMPF